MTFEQDITPQVFPIGGENGSGKSTLLQLIFALLHCSADPERNYFLNNTIMHMKRPYEKWELTRHDIATIELLYEDQKIEFEFFLVPLIENSNYDLSICRLGQILKSILVKKEELKMHEQKIQKEIVQRGLVVPQSLDLSEILKFFAEIIAQEQEIKKHSKDRYITTINKNVENLKSKIKDIETTLNQNIGKLRLIPVSIVELPAKDKNCDYGIFCKTSHRDFQLAKDALSFASNHIFLAGQPTQPYIFLDDNDIQELFKRESNYEKCLEKVRNFLPNFYNYNQFTVTEILEAFKIAKENDWQRVIETGEYGTRYNSLVKELRNIIGEEKYIVPRPQLDSIVVRYKTDKDNYLELDLEDLSHGELKRTSLYSWIKNKEINNSVVLIDEIENGLHPDWQYEIVRELASWGNNNQYLLGTHSFYLCEALTPRHVKELEPALTNPTEKKKEHVNDA